MFTLVALFAVMSCSGNAASHSPAPPAATARPAEPAATPQAPGPVSAERAFDELQQLLAFGPRPAGSEANARTRAHIIERLTSLGIDARPQAFTSNTVVGRVEFGNVIATLPGTRPERIIIGSHFDTRPEEAYAFVGANDGGSSTALLIELARVLKDRPREFTYEFVFFDGEEAWGDWSTGNTFGSRHYVTAARDAGTLTGVRAMILLDMVGERNIRLLRDMSSTSWLTNIIWETARELGHQRHFVDSYTAVEDDHIPFINAGIPAVDLIDLDYPAWHTEGDTIDKIDPQSMKIVGDVVVAALPKIEARLARE